MEFAPLVFAFYRFCLASLILAAMMAFKGKFFPFEKKQIPLLIFLAILVIPLNQCLFLYGLEYTLPSHPALLYATTPIWVYLLSAWRREEKMTGGKTIGIIIALAGVLAFFLEKGISVKTQFLFGDSLILLAVWSWSIYTVIGRPLVKKKGAIVVISVTLIMGTILYFPLGLYLALNFDYSRVSWVGWSGVAYTAILTSVLAYTIWYWSIKFIEPSRTAVFMNLQPIVTAILSYFILHERFTIAGLISGVVILIGVYVVQRSDFNNVVQSGSVSSA